MNSSQIDHYDGETDSTKPVANGEVRQNRAIGDRVVQGLLLLVIAYGVITIPRILTSSDGTSGGAAESPFASDSGAIAVETAAAGRGSIQEYIRVNGDVVTQSSVTIYPDTAGKVVERSVEVGQYVRAGEKIAVIDPSVPGQRFSTSTVSATIDGTITALNVNVGDTVSTQTAAATVGDLANLEVVTYVPERYVGSIRTGLVAAMTFAAFPDESVAARIVEISPVLDALSRTVEVRLIPTVSDSRVNAGMFATVRIVTKEASNALVVPAAAVTGYYGDEVVYVTTGTVGEELASGGAVQTVERRIVTTGLRSREAVEILNGLAEGETVVIAGLSRITDGSAVRIVGGK